MIKTAQIILVLSAFMLLTACSEQNDQHAFCNILPKQQVEKILNSSYHTAPVALLDSTAKGCKYISDTVEGRTFNIIFHKFDYPQKAKMAFEKSTNVWKNNEYKDRNFFKPDDIGEEAFWAGHNNKPQLIAYKETKLLILTMGGFNLEQEALLSAAKELAETILN
jgi:hypothetical protein